MANTNNVAFRSALSGYNREDVNQYILEMNRGFEEREAALRETADNAASQVEELTALSDSLKEKNAASEAVIAALRESSDQLKEENASLKEKAQSAEARAAEAEAQLRALKAEASIRTQAPEESEKSQKYDQISAQIGDILINANTSADQIIAAANTEANRIMTETEEEAMYIRTRLSDTADEMLTNISERLHISTEHCVTELMTALREMRDSTDALIRDFSKRSSDLGEKIEYYHTSVSDTVSKSLSDMDEKYGIRKRG